jgi:hypothetical protein
MITQDKTYACQDCAISDIGLLGVLVAGARVQIIDLPATVQKHYWIKQRARRSASSQKSQDHRLPSEDETVFAFRGGDGVDASGQRAPSPNEAKRGSFRVLFERP